MTLNRIRRGITEASPHAQKRSFMLFYALLGYAAKCVLTMRNYLEWCPGPDLNRHARVNEAQDFKSCASTNFATGALRKDKLIIS